jgi:hypothetical protein
MLRLAWVIRMRQDGTLLTDAVHCSSFDIDLSFLINVDSSQSSQSYLVQQSVRHPLLRLLVRTHLGMGASLCYAISSLSL